MDPAAVTSRHAPSGRVSLGGTGWFWRWGAPTASGLALLGAAGVAAYLGVNPSSALRGHLTSTVAAPAIAFAAALLACWGVVGRQVDTGSRTLAPLPARMEALSAVLVVATAVALAAFHLDVPLRYDESRTFLHYATLPLGEVLITYDSPNNHLLHTLLVWVAHHFGGWNWVALRLPAFLSFCLLLPALWWFVRREYSPTAALFAVVLVGVSPYFLAYATNARGYTLLLLFFVAALLCGQTLVRSPRRKALWAAWAVATALGAYVMPLMAFPAATAVTWMLLARRLRYGNDGFRSFAASVALWSVAALAMAAGLYLPVFAATGVSGAVEALGVENVERAIGVHERVLALPSLWWNWHSAFPAWARGLLLALVAAGAAAHGRSSGRGGTLLLATCLGFALMKTVAPSFRGLRFAMWASLVCTVLAGTGAAFVLEQGLVRLRTRWSGLAGARGRNAVECAALALVLLACTWWATRPRAVLQPADQPRHRPVLAAMTSSVDDWMRPGDYFTVCDLQEHQAAAYLSGSRIVEHDMGFWRPVAYHPAPRMHDMGANRVSSSSPEAKDSAPGVARASYSQWPPGSLFWFNFVAARSNLSLCPGGIEDARMLEALWPNYELVAAFSHVRDGRGPGRVWALHEWSPVSRPGRIDAATVTPPHAPSSHNHPPSGT